MGIILFEMLTGQVPHKAETPLATVVKRINEPLPLPRAINPDIPEAVERVLLRGLATNPAHRFDSAEEMVGALKKAFKAQPAQVSVDTAKDVAVPAQPLVDQVKSRAVQPAQIATPPPVPVQQPQSKSLKSMDIMALTLLGVISLCGVGGVLLSFLPDADTGQFDFALTPACLGMTFAGLTSMLMIWLRDKSSPASAVLAMGIVCWFIGVNILGWGGFAALSPGDDPFLENLGYSLVLCFAPGGILTLLGLGLYGYDYRRSRQAGFLADPQAVASHEDKQSRTEKLKRAAEYRTHITALIKQKKGSSLAGQLTPVTAKLNQWQAHLQQLVNRLNDFEANHILQRDIRNVPAAITRLEAQLQTETNPRVRDEIAETLAKHQEHQRQLDSLLTVMRRTELDIDETLAAIGAIYSQMQLLGAKDVDSHRANRLSADINEQANRLGDLLEAMDDVYESSAGFSSVAGS